MLVIKVRMHIYYILHGITQEFLKIPKRQRNVSSLGISTWK